VSDLIGSTSVAVATVDLPALLDAMLDAMLEPS